MCKPPHPLLSLLLTYPNISSQECTRLLAISQHTVYQQIEYLRSLEWNISSSPQEEFQVHVPYPFNIIPELIASTIPIPLLFAEHLESTNKSAKLLTQHAPFALITRNQFKGSGRIGRSWDMTPDKDLALSYIYTTNLPISFLFSIIRISALVVHQVLSDYGLKDILIKWPNDIITKNGKKICGILTEAISDNNDHHTLIIGIGLNVNSQNLPDYAQSVQNILGKDVDINALASHIITKLHYLLGKFPNNEEEIIASWEKNLAWIGEKTCLEYTGVKHEGIFKSCKKDGTLILEKNNKDYEFFAGDLTNIKFRKV